MEQGEMAEHGGGRRRLVLTASPLQGHMTPMLHLATFLHSKGFSITFAHSELNRPDPSNHPAFTFLPLLDHLSVTPGFANAVQFLQALNDNCRQHFQEHLVQIIKAQKDASEKESIVIIYDNLMYFAGSVAGDLGLPSIILRTSSASTFPAIKIIPQLHQEGRLPVQDSMLQEIVSELHPLRYKDLPFISLPIQQTLELINMIMPKTPPSAYMWNTLEFLEPSALTQIRNNYHVPIFTVGPLHKISPTPSSTSFLKEDSSCISWLDKQASKSVMYVSLGSLAKADDKVITEMAWGLANSNQPFLWVVRPGSIKGFEWIEFLPEGLVTEMKERGEIEGAIRRLLVSKEGEEMKQRALEIQEKVKVGVCHGGSSHNSLKELVDFILSL
ncbi:putative UDP-glucuronosyl/UDP-glucosyltransferase [Helianthus debilis subsp. tardiflorus]